MGVVVRRRKRRLINHDDVLRHVRAAMGGGESGGGGGDGSGAGGEAGAAGDGGGGASGGGVEVVDAALEEMTFSEQREVFRRASVMVAQYGTACHNVVFMRPGQTTCVGGGDGWVGAWLEGEGRLGWEGERRVTPPRTDCC